MPRGWLDGLRRALGHSSLETTAIYTTARRSGPRRASSSRACGRGPGCRAWAQGLIRNPREGSDSEPSAAANAAVQGLNQPGWRPKMRRNVNSVSGIWGSMSKHRPNDRTIHALERSAVVSTEGFS